MIEINKEIQTGKWFDYSDDEKFLICAFPFTEVSLLKSNELDNDLIVSKKVCEYCLLGWKGLKDKNDVKFEFNEENKKFLLDYNENVRMFVHDCIN